jgi:hypothetical protein
VRQHRRSADVRDVGDGAMPFEFQLPLANLTPRVQLVEVLVRLRNQTVEARHGLAGDLAIQKLRELDLLPVDEGIQTDLDVPLDPRPLGERGVSTPWPSPSR